MRNIVNHHEGLSSDDEESQADVTKFSMEQGGRLPVACISLPGMLLSVCQIPVQKKKLPEVFVCLIFILHGIVKLSVHFCHCKECESKNIRNLSKYL